MATRSEKIARRAKRRADLKMLRRERRWRKRERYFTRCFGVSPYHSGHWYKTPREGDAYMADLTAYSQFMNYFKIDAPIQIRFLKKEDE